MKKLLFALSLVFGATLFVAAQDANPNAAEIVFDAETIDYGTIEQGANGQRIFTFTNSGKEPLIITNAKGSCGCTVPTWPREPIAPGESGEIKVKYDTKRVGPFSKSVTINSNAKNSTKVLHIKGVVKQAAPVQTTPVKEEKTSMIQQ